MARKSVGAVNLTLTGEMLNSIELIDNNNIALTIGFKDELQAAKAHAHITGANGRTPVRDFLGLPPFELSSILKTFPATSAALQFETFANAREIQLLADAESTYKNSVPTKLATENTPFDYLENYPKEDDFYKYREKEVKDKDSDKYINAMRETRRQGGDMYRIYDFYLKTKLSYQAFWDITNAFIEARLVELVPLSQSEFLNKGNIIPMWKPNSWKEEIKKTEGAKFIFSRYRIAFISF